MATSMAHHAAYVWVFQRQDRGYSPYPPQTSADIEATYSAGGNAIIVGNYSIDVKKCVQTSTSTGRSRGIKRIPCVAPPPSIMAYWEWNDHGHNFVPYDISAIVDIETAYSHNQRSVNLSTTPANIPYTIDFTLMHQTRHHYNTKRQIRRVPLLQPLVNYLQPQQPSFSLAAPAATPYPQSATNFLSPLTSMLSSPATPSGSSGVTPATPSGSSPGRSSKASKIKSAASSKKTKAATSSRRSASAAQAMSAGPLGPMSRFVEKVTTLSSSDNGPCPICMNQLSEVSGFEDEAGLPATTTPTSSSAPPTSDLCQLVKCKHILHQACLIMFIKNSPDAKHGLRCPTCKKIYGVKTGDMPDGQMTWTTHSHYSLPGHEGCGVIVITYNFSPGVHNGVRYRTNGFPRTCYLPNSVRGQKILRLLKVAWDRKLTFTIGTSVTTGAKNTIVWNEIHHKTESTSNASGHGYPDPAYLDNVTAELAAQGVEEGDDNDDD